MNEILKTVKNVLELKALRAEKDKDNSISGEDYAFFDGKERAFNQAIQILIDTDIASRVNDAMGND